MTRQTDQQMIEAYTRAVMILFAPAFVIHELAHLVVGRRWADRIEMDWSPLSGERPRITFVYPPGVEGWKVVCTNLAPVVLGVALAPAVIWMVTTYGLTLPVAYLTLVWIGIAMPSAEDLAVLKPSRQAPQR